MTESMDQDQLRNAFRGANAIVALEGWTPTADDLALQERAIRGELSFDEAVKCCIADVRSR